MKVKLSTHLNATVLGAPCSLHTLVPTTFTPQHLVHSTVCVHHSQDLVQSCKPTSKRRCDWKYVLAKEFAQPEPLC